MPSQLRSLLGTIRKKPTKASDGRSDEEASGMAAPKKTAISSDLRTLGLKNAKFAVEAITTLASGDPIDDKELMLEHGVEMLQGLPLNSGLSAKVSDGFIAMLWNDLPHPTPTMAGQTARYRKHDGSGNNPWNPEMGKAGSPYARNVPPSKPKGKHFASTNNIDIDALRRAQSAQRRGCVRILAQARGSFPPTSVRSQPSLLFLRYNRHPRMLPDLQGESLDQRDFQLRGSQYLVWKHRKGAAASPDV